MGTRKHLVLFRHFVYAGKGLLARVTAKTGAAASSVMRGCSFLDRLRHACNGQAKGGRRATVELKNRCDFLGKGRERGVRR